MEGLITPGFKLLKKYQSCDCMGYNNCSLYPWVACWDSGPQEVEKLSSDDLRKMQDGLKRVEMGSGE